MDRKLRYQIDSWDKLPNCLSNNSRKLHIFVSHYLNDSAIKGIRVAVKHDEYGVLFSCIVNGSGSLLDEEVSTFTTPQILQELARFGFLVKFETKVEISKTQLQLIRGAWDLGFDRLRVLSVWHMERGEQVHDTYIVAFMSSHNQDWLNDMYSPSVTEYKNAVLHGEALDVMTLSKDKHLDWSWLYGEVHIISDVLSRYSSELYTLARRNLVTGKIEREVYDETNS